MNNLKIGTVIPEVKIGDTLHYDRKVLAMFVHHGVPYLVLGGYKEEPMLIDDGLIDWDYPHELP